MVKFAKRKPLVPQGSTARPDPETPEFLIPFGLQDNDRIVGNLRGKLRMLSHLKEQ